jgi:hypothetical protein
MVFKGKLEKAKTAICKSCVWICLDEGKALSQAYYRKLKTNGKAVAFIGVTFAGGLYGQHHTLSQRVSCLLYIKRQSEAGLHQSSVNDIDLEPFE